MLKELEPLVDQLKMCRGDLQQALDGLIPEQLFQPFPNAQWSIKDEIAHIAADESLQTELLRSIATGAPSPLPPDFDPQKYDQEGVAKSRDKTLAQVWSDLEQSHARLLNLLDSLTPEHLERRGSHPLQGMLTVKEFLVIIYSHEVNHVRGIIEQVRRFRRSSKAA